MVSTAAIAIAENTIAPIQLRSASFWGVFDFDDLRDLFWDFDRELVSELLLGELVSYANSSDDSEAMEPSRI
jgi:hypothetical protein